MAREISETPILFGDDATRFINDMNNVKPASEEEKKQAEHAYEWMKSIATFNI